MTFLVDANIVLYAAISSDWSDACEQIVLAISDGRADGQMSTATLEEVLHVELAGKIKGIDGLARRTYDVFHPLLPITDAIVARALALDHRKLGANDRIHVATALANGIDAIVTADAAFDGVPGIRRIDPRNDRERLRLLER